MDGFDPAVLKAAAVKITGDFSCSDSCSAGSVGAALLTEAGDIFTGICIDARSSLGFCAEHAAIAEMLKHRQTRIRAIVAVDDQGQVLPPCGRCRELIRQTDPANWNTRIILAGDTAPSCRIHRPPGADSIRLVFMARARLQPLSIGQVWVSATSTDGRGRKSGRIDSPLRFQYDHFRGVIRRYRRPMTETRVQRRLATILVADVVGYSRLIGVDEAGTLATVKDRWAQILEPLVREHDGRIVKFMGDGALIEFSSAVNAVQCALVLQKRMAEANEGEPELRQIILRIGINLGDVVIDGSDILGEGVNIAARLEPLARPGELCIAANVYDAVRGKLELSAEDLGQVELKNVSQPVRAFQVAIDGARGVPRANQVQTENTLSIAVLPFGNMSGVPEQDYISDGIAENILTDLSRFHDLTVIARNSSFAYKGRATRIQDIRRDLGVNYVLEGSVQRAGDRIRVTAQLIEGATGKHLWAERYDRRVDDLFAVMDEITQLIVGTLGTTYGGRLRKAASEVAAGAGPTSFRAFDHFVQGMQELNKFTKESIAASITHFEKAISINPRYAKAHAKIAWAHLMNLFFGWGNDDAASLKNAQDAANAAVRTDDAEAWAHWAVAGCAMTQRQHDRALMGMRRALELNPNDADVLTDMGIFCAYAGKAEEGLVYALKGMKINPHYPDYYADQLGQIYFDAHQYENAIRTFEGIRTNNTPYMLFYLAASHAALGHDEAAHAYVAKLLASEPQSTVSYWVNLIPYREDRDREHMAANLRLAGLPE